MKAFRKESWSTSSASCQFFVIRYILRSVLLEWRSQSATNAERSPDFAAETSNSSLSCSGPLVIAKQLSYETGGVINIPLFENQSRRLMAGPYAERSKHDSKLTTTRVRFITRR